MTQIIISSSPSALEAELAKFIKTATVEAEFGDVCVRGSELTLAHHGPRSGNPAPCLWEERVPGVEAIGISHVDLDTMGGILAILGSKPIAPSFWELAAFVDVHGPHKLSESGASDEDLRRLYAVWAWQQAHRSELDTRTTKEKPVKFFTIDHFNPWFKALQEILGGSEELLNLGDEFRKAGEALNAASFVEAADGVIVRVSDTFINHLYVTPDGDVCEAVVALSTRTHGITVSLADPVEGFSVGEFLQDHFGPEAGGRNVIGGTPRGQFMKLSDLLDVYDSLRKRLRGEGKGIE